MEETEKIQIKVKILTVSCRLVLRAVHGFAGTLSTFALSATSQSSHTAIF